MFIKKLLALLLCVICMVSFNACTSDKADKNAEPTDGDSGVQPQGMNEDTKPPSNESGTQEKAGEPDASGSHAADEALDPNTLIDSPPLVQEDTEIPQGDPSAPLGSLENPIAEEPVAD